jgi:hypothetical protein
MDDAEFDRLARAFHTSGTRRWLFAVLATVFGAVFGLFRHLAASASQLGPPTCGEQGAVCTLLSGCCDGLTCATSAINTSYGICVPGEGGMVSTGTTLISPFSETAVEEVAPLVQAAATAPTTDPQADRKAHIEELRARKDAKRSKQKTRLDTKRSTQQTRKDEQQNRELEARKAAEVALGPTLQFELINPGGGIGTPETLRISNLDDASVLLAKIESVLNPTENNATNRTVLPGGAFNYYSGITDDISDQDEQQWNSNPVCSGNAGAGFRVSIGANANSVNQQHVILCNGPSLIRVNEAPVATPVQKRKKHNGKKRNDQHQKKEKR